MGFFNFLLREWHGFPVITHVNTHVRFLPQSGHCAVLRRAMGLLGIFATAVLVTSVSLAREDTAEKMAFDLPADDAERSLKQFSARSGLEVLFVSDSVASVRTNAVKGDFTPREVIDRMLEGTKLSALQQEKNGAIRIISAASANGRGGAADSARSSVKKKHPAHEN
ncbi:MAG: STN domain-containing protein [Opitutaceae bacterium]|nr:STN domain-containing protein [Opitutaceae bacterium]